MASEPRGWLAGHSCEGSILLRLGSDVGVGGVGVLELQGAALLCVHLGVGQQGEAGHLRINMVWSIVKVLRKTIVVNANQGSLVFVDSYGILMCEITRKNSAVHCT